MNRVLLTVLFAALLGCAAARTPSRPPPAKQYDPALRFPRPGEIKRDPIDGPLLRAMWTAALDFQRHLEQDGAPRCLATSEGVDLLVGEGEVQLTGSKQPTKVFYISAWPNPKRCSVPESQFTDVSFDYIVAADGRLLKAASLRHTE